MRIETWCTDSYVCTVELNTWEDLEDVLTAEIEQDIANGYTGYRYLVFDNAGQRVFYNLRAKVELTRVNS